MSMRMKERMQRGSVMDVIDLIPSNDMREALREDGRVFTDMEKATIIHNLRLGPERTRRLLEQLEAETDDDVLREQLRCILAEGDRLMRRFREDDEGYAYVVTLYDDESQPTDGLGSVYFDSFSLAYEFGRAQKVPFEVSKWHVYDRIPEGSVRECITDVGTLVFDETADLTDDDLWDMDISEPQRASVMTSGEECPYYMHFWHRWLDLPNLYERGEIVRVLDKLPSYIHPAYDWAVVNVDPEGWEEHRQRVNDWLAEVEQDEGAAHDGLADYSDMQILVEFPCKDGTFMHAHINPMFLERDGREAAGDEAELRQMASWAAKGECGLDWISSVLKKRMLAELGTDCQ